MTRSCSPVTVLTANNKQCYCDLCILLNLKYDLMADLFWEKRMGECTIENCAKYCVGQDSCCTESITGAQIVSAEQFCMFPTAIHSCRSLYAVKAMTGM
jgi:hypothetical protein